MGNTVVKCCASGEVVRIMRADGNVEEMEWPISAGEVMKRHPSHLVIDSTRLEKKQKYQVVETGQKTNKVLLMRPHMALQPGHLYILCPVPVQAEPELSTSLSISDIPVLPQPSVTRSYSYGSSDSKTIRLTNSPSSNGSHESFEQLEKFHTTFKRRRASMVIASDILHSFQVREEAVADELNEPVEPKEEKPRGHGWSPSLSSIPESPAGSLRLFEPTPQSKQEVQPTPQSKQENSKLPPRNSTNINKLLKQALLNKHPRSFWR